MTICLGDWEKIFKITSGASEGTGCTEPDLIGAATTADLTIAIQTPLPRDVTWLECLRDEPASCTPYAAPRPPSNERPMSASRCCDADRPQVMQRQRLEEGLAVVNGQVALVQLLPNHSCCRMPQAIICDVQYQYL